MNKLILVFLLSIFLKDIEAAEYSNKPMEPENSIEKDIEITKRFQADTLKYPPCIEEEIPHYKAYRVNKAPKLDGRLDDEVWQHVPKSPRFRDLIN